MGTIIPDDDEDEQAEREEARDKVAEADIDKRSAGRKSGRSKGSFNLSHGRSARSKGYSRKMQKEADDHNKLPWHGDEE
jgi:hypothetical protein